MSDIQDRFSLIGAAGARDAETGDTLRLLKRIEAVNEASLIIASELSVGPALQKIVDLARQISGARYCALGVPDNRGGLAQFITSGMTEAEIGSMDHYPRGYGLLGLLLREKQPLRVKNIGEDPRSVGFPAHHPPMSSFLGVPIISKGRILGNFYLTEKIGAEEFSEEDERIIVLLAAHAAIAIENAILHGQTDDNLRRQVAALERSERRAGFLAEVSSLLSSSLDVLPLLDQVAKKSTGVLGDTAVIALVEKEAAHGLAIHSIHGSSDDRIEGCRSVIELALPVLSETVAERTETFFYAKSLKNSGTGPASKLLKAMNQAKFSSGLAVPLSSGQKVYGVFASLATQPQEFNEADLQLATTVGERMGVAVENAHLYDDLKRALGLRTQFISVASHELKTPITSMKIAGQLIQRQMERRNAECDMGNMPQQMKLLVRQIDRMARLANQLLDVTRLEAGRLELFPEPTELVALARAVTQQFAEDESLEKRHDVTLNTSAPEIWGEWDPGRLEQVLVNILSNAIKYSPDGGQVQVELRRMDEEVQVTVSDQGLGIPPDHLNKVFDAFYRVSGQTAGHISGLGLGLHICREIVELHGGRIWAESAGTAGTTIRFVLPVRKS